MSNSIKHLLRIKDKNITITGEPFDEKRKDRVCTVIPAELFNRPKACAQCGFKNTHIVHSWEKPSYVKLLPSAGYHTFLKLKKCRFICKNCRATCVSQTNLVEKNRFISTAVRQSIALDLAEKLTISYIAKKHNVSTCSAYRVFQKYNHTFKPNFHYLPYVMNFDEFKGVGGGDTAMNFIFMDGLTGKIVDILRNRRIEFLSKYFLQYPRKVRVRVQFIVIDMHSPYMTLIKQVFPKAKIITDRFHVIQHIGRAMTGVRIEVMNSFRTSSKEDRKKYRRLKRYWRLLQMSDKKLNSMDYRKFVGFKGLTTTRDIVDELLSYSEKLSSHYKIYQAILFSFETKDTDRFIELIHSGWKLLDSRFKTAFKTFRKHIHGIHQSLKKQYSNGKLEAMNNHIKVLKRIAYGYRNFENFRRRILIVQGYLEPLEKKKDAPYLPNVA
jgi:transposase